MSDDSSKQVVMELDWGPNDLLVVTAARMLNPEQRTHLREALTVAASGEGRQAIVLDGGLELTLLRRDDRLAEDDEDEPLGTYMDGTPIG